MIKKLDDQSILNICANQVVTDLATCVKELVENSIDARASLIEVSLRDFGKELIEVKDNGTGIASENFQVIAEKGATSKLGEFSDLGSVKTYGFRGEALNSIAHVSELQIITQTAQEELGWRLVFDSQGKISKCDRVATEVGTIIQIKNLFYTIPVRQIEYHKNSKLHYNKLTNFLTEYALI